MKILINILCAALALAIITCPILTKGDTASMIALAQHGKPYVFNTEGPDTFDCSGLILYSYGMLGKEIEHWANGIANDEQYETFNNVSQAHVGDLIFFDTVEDNDVPADHVGVWIGSNRFVHASSTGEKVMVSKMDDTWKQRFIWGKRIVGLKDQYMLPEQTAEETA